MGKFPWSDREAERRENRRPQPKEKVVKIAKRTEEGKRQDQLYSQMRKKFLSDNPLCQCCQPGCSTYSTQVHHKKGRGIWLLITKFWLAVCANCHEWIEKNPAEAKEKGFSLNRIE